MIEEGNLIVVMGPSGAGKSSLVRAGLVARLGMAHSGWVVVEPFVPGSRPLDQLSNRLADLVTGQLTEGECRDRLLQDGIGVFGEWLVDHATARGKRLLITLDQAELLSTVAQPGDQQTFLSMLGEGVGGDSPVTVVMTVRSDRFDEIQRLPVIGPMIHDPFVIAPMSRSQLTAVIEGPAIRAGLEFEAGLVGRLIDDAVRGGTGDAVDALPLLAFTLREMYDLTVKENRDTIIESDYDRVGRIEGAILRRTEAAESSLPPGSRPALEHLLTRFVTLSEEPLPASSPVARDRLSADEESIVQKLEDQRLLVGTGDNVHLAHEQLITAWPTLKRAVEERHEDLLLQTRIERQANEWKQGHGELLGRDAADSAAEWLSERADADSGRGVVGEYVQVSVRALRRRSARRFALLTLIVALALVASSVAVLAVVKQSDANKQAQLAQSGTAMMPKLESSADWPPSLRSSSLPILIKQSTNSEAAIPSYSSHIATSSAQNTAVNYLPISDLAGVSGLSPEHLFRRRRSFFQKFA
jgi:energy-coupling factor transporter ATP-binding protein EcfA2